MPDSPCETCHQPHITPRGAWAGQPSCSGHVIRDRASYVKGEDRKLLDQPRPCAQTKPKSAPDGWKCRFHGGAAGQVKAKRERLETEQKVRALLGEAGEPVTDPIGKLCAIAGRAVALMEALATRVDDPTESATSLVIYSRSIKDAATVVESIIRMGIAERLAKQDADRTSAIVGFIDGVLTELGHNPRDPEVAAVVVRMLERAA